MSDFDPDQLVGKLDEMLPLIQEISSKFKDAVSIKAIFAIESDFINHLSLSFDVCCYKDVSIINW